MKKLALSFGLILAFAFYILFANSKSVSLKNSSVVQSSENSSSSQTQTDTSVSVLRNDDSKKNDDYVPIRFRSKPKISGGIAPTQPTGNTSPQTGANVNPPAQPAPIAQPAQEPAPIAQPEPVILAKYKDGSYTGNAVDAYFGIVQVKAIIEGGKITDVQFLKYPNDRQTSIEISNNSMPILKQEAIAKQDSKVDIVSGATQTSEGFQTSLASALSLAKN